MESYGRQPSSVEDDTLNELPSICASLTKEMVHCICTCDTQLWHFVLVAFLPTGRSRVSTKFSSRS